MLLYFKILVALEKTDPKNRFAVQAILSVFIYYKYVDTNSNHFSPLLYRLYQGTIRRNAQDMRWNTVTF